MNQWHAHNFNILYSIETNMSRDEDFFGEKGGIEQINNTQDLKYE